MKIHDKTILNNILLKMSLHHDTEKVVKYFLVPQKRLQLMHVVLLCYRVSISKSYKPKQRDDIIAKG